MRPRRPRLVLPSLWILALLGCDGNQQGYYGPCDEALGLAAGCPAEAGSDEQATPADACLKLASCGVIHMSEQPPEGADPDEYETQFELCLQLVQESLGDDPGGVLLACIEESSCADLQRSDVGDMPDPDPRPIELVIGWCGRFDP